MSRPADAGRVSAVHPSAHAQMGLSIQRYMEKGRRYRVLDFGSGTSPRQTLNHRSLLGEYDCEFTGVDVRAGNNVDIVMKKVYRIPLRSGSVDVVLSGQVFEHVPFLLGIDPGDQPRDEAARVLLRDGSLPWACPLDV